MKTDRQTCPLTDCGNPTPQLNVQPLNQQGVLGVTQLALELATDCTCGLVTQGTCANSDNQFHKRIKL